MRRRLVDLALAGAVGWCLIGLVLLVLTYSYAASVPIGSPGFVEQAVFFGTRFGPGRSLLLGSAITGVLALGCLLVRTATGTGVLVAIAMVGLWSMVVTGHGADSLNHDSLVDLQFLHVLGVSVWLGGLLALVFTHRMLGAHLLPTVRRYSVLAGWCLLAVALSGLVSAALRVQQVSGLWSSYGAILGLKSAAVTVLATLGWWQRRRLIGQLADGRPRALLRIACLEVGVLAAATGAAVALSRTEPPSPSGAEDLLTPAQALLGTDLPPPLGLSEWFTQWSIDTLWLLVALLLLTWYLHAVRRLHRRGDRWPVLRTICWVVGWLLLVWATNGSPGAYGRVLFSMHVVQHMTISTAVPMLLVLGAPVTLALRTLPRRRDGSAGPREWLHRVVVSLPFLILGTPIVAAGLFVVGPVAFYYSSLFGLSLESHTARVATVGSFLFSGYLFANCLVGIDPAPLRPAYPLRVLVVTVTLGFHALFSGWLMASNRALASTWFETLGRTWGRSPLEDQRLGAALGWALGGYPLALVAGVLIALWWLAHRRTQRRSDEWGDADAAASRPSTANGCDP